MNASDWEKSVDFWYRFLTDHYLDDPDERSAFWAWDSLTTLAHIESGALGEERSRLEARKWRR